MGEACIMSHFCPKGPKCPFFKQGKCKFIGSKRCVMSSCLYPAYLCPEYMHGALGNLPPGDNGIFNQGFPTPMHGPPGSSSGMASPVSYAMSDHQLSPLASPFARNGYVLDENAPPWSPPNGTPLRVAPSHMPILLSTPEHVAQMYGGH